MISRRKFFRCFYLAAYDTVQHDGVEHAGYLAFLSILALFPFIVFFVALTGFLGQSEIGTRFVDLIITNLPNEAINALKPRIVEIVSGPPQGLLTLAIVGTIWTASSTFEGLRTTLNRAYRVETPPTYILRRLLSILQFVIFTLGIMAVMFLLVLGPIIWEKIYVLLHIDEDILPYTWKYLRYFIGVFMLFLVVSAGYYVLPNVKQHWFEVVPGAIIVVILWLAFGSVVFHYLAGYRQVSFVYGGLAGIILALLFFYICAMIYIFGAEFNYRIERAFGRKVRQKEIGRKKMSEKLE